MRYISISQTASNEFTSLIPTHASVWSGLIGDVLCSPAIQRLIKACDDEMTDRGEYSYLSIDGSRKPCFSLLGQAAYRAPKSVQRAQAVQPEDQKHSVLTGLGKTSGVLLLELVRSESSGQIVTAYATNFNTKQKESVQFVATDDPSPKLLRELAALFPNLRCIALDTMHLVFVYEQAFWEKQTPGSCFLRQIVSKFIATVGRIAGGMFDGSQILDTTIWERRVQAQLRNKNMGKRKANLVMDSLDTTRCFSCRAEFVECLAALARLYPKELKRKNTSGRTLHQILISAAEPARVEWMLNLTRIRKCYDAADLQLLPSGTCANESVNNLLKRLAMGQKMHQSSLQMKLNAFRLKKGLAHNAALYHETTVQMKETLVLHRLVSALQPWSDQDWAAWCHDQVDEHGRIQSTASPLHERRSFLQKACSAWSKAKAVTRKTSKESMKRKRTVFTLDKRSRA